MPPKTKISPVKKPENKILNIFNHLRREIVQVGECDDCHKKNVKLIEKQYFDLKYHKDKIGIVKTTRHYCLKCAYFNIATNTVVTADPRVTFIDMYEWTARNTSIQLREALPELFEQFSEKMGRCDDCWFENTPLVGFQYLTYLRDGSIKRLEKMLCFEHAWYHNTIDYIANKDPKLTHRDIYLRAAEMLGGDQEQAIRLTKAVDKVAE